MESNQSSPKASRLRPVRLQKTPAHLEGAANLERLCFPAAPWSAQSLELLTNEGIGVGYLLTDPADGTVVAYGGMLITVDEGQITNIAVHPDHRRRGAGRLLMDAIEADARRRAFNLLSLEVRVSNEPAIALYRAYGFEVAGVRRGFYTAPREDAYVMLKNLA